MHVLLRSLSAIAACLVPLMTITCHGVFGGLKQDGQPLEFVKEFRYLGLFRFRPSNKLAMAIERATLHQHNLLKHQWEGACESQLDERVSQ